jgi:glutamate-1-semialdehyde 2,1-aminomutase/spore coat polysaccharide biosynthesis protein SpsF
VTELSASRAWWERGRAVIPLGTQTLSKSPTQFVQGALPIYLERGQGSHVWDVDGNEWLDYPMALGPVLLGYCEPVVDDAIRAQLEKGITFTLMHPLEVEVAERIVALCPGVEAVRFGKSGSDAMTGAVRAARAITDRDHVLVAGYHGWHDWYIGTTTRSSGVPPATSQLTSTFPFNDLPALEEALRSRPGSVAAVVVEPSGLDVPEPGYLSGLVELARHHGALSIFDEVITGFRVAPGGARQRYDVEPDLSCYGKALGNGMPISAIGGRWSTMRVFEEIFFSGTHGGEALALAAARAVLDTIADGQVLASIEERGRRLQAALIETVAQHGIEHRVRISGEPHRSVVSMPDDPDLVTKSFVQQTFAEHGILFNGSLFICARHSDDDVTRTVTALDAACQTIAATPDLRPLLVGPPVAPVFRNP